MTDQPLNNTVTAEEIVEAVLVKYSSPDGRETCCSKQELKRDLVRIMKGFVRERDSIQQMHDAYLRMGALEYQDKRPFLQRVLGW